MSDAPLRQRMTSLDASFLYLEQPNALLHVGAIFTFARRLDFNRLLSYLEERLPLIPRYLQRAMMVPLNLGHPTWEMDPEFDIHDHVIRHHLRGTGNAEALAQLCAKLFAEPLQRTRPLWEMHVIDGYGDGCAILSKTHHCMIDGASGVQLTNLLMDPSPKPAPLPARSLPKPTTIAHPLVRATEAALDSIRKQTGALFAAAQQLRRPAQAMAEIRATLDAVGTLTRTVVEGPPRMPFNGEIGKKRSVAWAPLSLNEVRAIKSRLGGTVNDVVLSVICGGLRNYLLEARVSVDGVQLKVGVPVSVRSEGDRARLGNRVSMMIAPLPLDVDDPVERLRRISGSMEVLKHSGESRQMERLLSLGDLLPPILQPQLARLQGIVTPVNTVITNVPGPRETRYLLGEPVRQMVPLVPLAARIGLGFAILSYADQLTIGIHADAGQVISAWRVERAVRRAFEDLWAATGLERVVAKAKVESALKRRGRIDTKV